MVFGGRMAIMQRRRRFPPAAMLRGLAGLRAVPEGLWALEPSARQATLLYVLSAGLLAIGAVAGAVCGVMAFADGGYFVFGMATGDPWHLFWNNVPQRAAAYVITIAPLEWALDRGLLSVASLLPIYSAVFLGFPVACMALAPLSLGREQRRLLIYPALALAGIAPLLYGFPTEVWLMLGAFWVVLFTVIGRARARARLAVFALSLPVLLFLHDLGILLSLVILGFVALRALLDREKRVTAGVMLGVALPVLACWLWVKLYVPIPDPVFARQIAGNGAQMLDPRLMLKSGPLVAIALATLLVLGLAWRRVDRGRAAIAAVLLFAVMVAAGGYMLKPFIPGHYTLRILVTGINLGLAGLAFMSDVSGTPRPRPAYAGMSGWTVLLATAVIAQQAVMTGFFLRDWSTYRSTLGGLASAPARTPDLDLADLGPALAGADARTRRIVLTQMNWGWPTLYQNYVLSNFRPHRLFVHMRHANVLSCATVSAVDVRGLHIPVRDWQPILRYVCNGRAP